MQKKIIIALRPLFTIVLLLVPLAVSGCGDAESTGQGEALPAAEDPSLDPANDSTMNP